MFTEEFNMAAAKPEVSSAVLLRVIDNTFWNSCAFFA